MLKNVSLLLLATLLALAFLFSTAGLESMSLPNLLDVLTVFLFSDFDWRWQNCNDIRVTILVCPVGGGEAMCVPNVFNISRVRTKVFAQIEVAVAGSNMQAREAHLILYFWVATALHEHLHDLDHIILGS